MRSGRAAVLSAAEPIRPWAAFGPYNRESYDSWKPWPVRFSWPIVRLPERPASEPGRYVAAHDDLRVGANPYRGCGPFCPHCLEALGDERDALEGRRHTLTHTAVQTPYLQGYRDGFHGLPRTSAHPDYLAGYRAGRRASDRSPKGDD